MLDEKKVLAKVDKGEKGRNPPKPSEWVDELNAVIWNLFYSLRMKHAHTNTHTQRPSTQHKEKDSIKI